MTGGPGQAMSVPDEAQRPAATVDRLLGGRVVLHQAAEGYRAAIDPVLLAAAVPARTGERALDLGCGDGAAMLCLAARVPGVALTGLERDPAAAARARAGASDSGLADRVTVVEGSVDAPPASLARAFDHVLANPPFHPWDHTGSPDAARAAANRETAAGLAPWVAAAHACLRPRGRLVLIHRADRLDRALAALAPRFGSFAVVPLWPRAGRPAKRVVVIARAGGRGPMSLLPGLVLHGDGATFTGEAQAVLADAAPLVAAR